MEISREINESLKDFIVKNIIYMMIKNDVPIKNSNILVLGVTFKENCNDIRNSKIVDVLNELELIGVNLTIYDPYADKNEVKREYDIDLVNEYNGKYDVILFAVAHDEFKEISLDDLNKLSKKEPIIIDLKSLCNDDIQNIDSYWSL
jgi:UDP-N-acetyl-D-galactosamine dehydrogenase